MAIARVRSMVIDCPDPGALAAFYGAMLDWKVEVSPGWPGPAQSTRVHLLPAGAGLCPAPVAGQEAPAGRCTSTLTVDDLDAAETAVLELGATRREHQPGESFRVFLDPAGHPILPLPGLIRTA